MIETIDTWPSHFDDLATDLINQGWRLIHFAIDGRDGNYVGVFQKEEDENV